MSSRCYVAFCAVLFAIAPSALCSAPASQTAQTTIRSVAVVGEGEWPQIQIEASGPASLSTQSITGPDRIVIDFQGAVPAATLRNLPVHRGHLKAVRTGLFQSQPPVTRVVLDMEGPAPFRVFPSGNRTVIMLGTGSAPEAAADAVPPAPPKSLAIQVKPALLTIEAENVTLSEVLYELQRRTGAEIAIPAGAEQEKVVIHLGPAPGKEVLSAMLNGTRFNFIIVGGEQDPGGIRQVVLTNKSAADASLARPSGPPIVNAIPVPDAGAAEPADVGEEVQPIPEEPEPAPLQANPAQQNPPPPVGAGQPQQPGQQMPPEQQAPEQ